MPLLRREYLPSAVNRLKTVLRFCISLGETFETWMSFTGINKYGKFVVVLLWTVFWPAYHVTCQRVLWNGTFLDIYLTTFFKVRKFKNLLKLLPSSFSWKCSKLNLNLENLKRNSENFFHFWDNCIKKCCNKLPLLRREYLLLPLNRLTKFLRFSM